MGMRAVLTASRTVTGAAVVASALAMAVAGGNPVDKLRMDLAERVELGDELATIS